MERAKPTVIVTDPWFKHRTDSDGRGGRETAAKNGPRRQIDAAARRKSNFFYEFHSTARTFAAPFERFNPTPPREILRTTFFLSQFGHEEWRAMLC